MYSLIPLFFNDSIPFKFFGLFEKKNYKISFYFIRDPHHFLKMQFSNLFFFLYSVLFLSERCKGKFINFENKFFI